MKKKVRLTFGEWWNRFWGKYYVVNHNKKEIHRLWHKHVNCLNIARKNREYVTETQALILIAEKEYNGCRWCWPEKDNG